MPSTVSLQNSEGRKSLVTELSTEDNLKNDHHKKKKNRKRKLKAESDDEGISDERLLQDKVLLSKLQNESRLLQLEVENANENPRHDQTQTLKNNASLTQPHSKTTTNSKLPEKSEKFESTTDDEDYEDEDGREHDDSDSESESDYNSEIEDNYNDLDVEFLNDSDRALFEKYMPKTNTTRSLADLVMKKLEETAEETDQKPKGSTDKAIPPKIIEVYSKIGELLSRYRSGKLPKALKMIPSLPNWKIVIELTQPEEWSPQACFQMVRLMISNLSPKEARIFMQNIILPHFRNDISENKKLNVHLYMALKKAFYKPSAWFQGFLFPLVESDCSLKEAAIASSVITKVSVPALHSGVALLRLCTTKVSSPGPQAIFMRSLLDKKYALPYKVIDHLVIFFSKWASLERSLAVLEQQMFLVFCQRYKNDITEDQRNVLLLVNKVKGHHKIGLEIQRELSNAELRASNSEANIEQ